MAHTIPKSHNVTRTNPQRSVQEHNFCNQFHTLHTQLIVSREVVDIFNIY